MSPGGDDRYGAGGCADGHRDERANRDDQIRVPADHLASEIGKPPGPPLAGIPLDDEVLSLDITLLHGSAAKRSQPRAPTVYGRRTYSGRPSSSMRFSDATAMATSVVCRPSVRERSASPITRL